MRIALVSREFAPLFGAGIGTYAAQMARAWARAGHEVHVVTGAHAGLAERGPASCPGVAFHAVDPGRPTGRTALDAYRFDFLRHAMGVHGALAALHARAPLDYIEFPEYWAEGHFALAARRSTGAYDGAVKGVRLHTPTRVCRALNREDWLDEEIATLEHAEGEGIRGADVVVSPTRSLLEMVHEGLVTGRAHGLPPKTVAKPWHGVVIPYPFDLGSVAELGSGEPERSARPVVLFYGRMEHRKGLHILVDAAHLLLSGGVDAEFRFIGGDTKTGPHGRSYREWVRSRVRPEWRGRVVFESARARAALGAAVRGAAVCCFPSLWENFPNACLEAMALSAVVVGSDAGGMAEIIRDGEDGVLFCAGDAASLAGAIGRAIADGALRARCAAGAPARVASVCDPAGVVRAFEALIAETRRAQVPAAAPARVASGGGAAPAVSVVIPFYHLAAFLPRTLESVRGQTYRDFETVLVDDGSDDPASAVVLREVEAGRHGPVRVVRQANAGLSSARNAGIGAARGRWIVPLDADDALEPVFLERCVGASEREPGLTFVTSLVEYFTQTPGDRGEGWVPLGVERDLLAYTNCASTCTALIERGALLAAGAYDPWLTSYEDWDLWCRLAKGGATGVVIPEFLIHYRCRPDSMVRTEGRARRDAIRACLLARHADLPLHPDRTMRLHLSRAAQGEGAEERASRIIEENIRYRVVDRLNSVLKAAGVHRALKGVAVLLGAANGAPGGRGVGGGARAQ
ncbi:MAG: glycosyltransferase, partial [Phycisphaerales bacterium]